jgi:hypothetical protein
VTVVLNCDRVRYCVCVCVCLLLCVSVSLCVDELVGRFGLGRASVGRILVPSKTHTCLPTCLVARPMVQDPR